MQIKQLEATNATYVKNNFQRWIILKGTSGTITEWTEVKSVSFVPASSETSLTVNNMKT